MLIDTHCHLSDDKLTEPKEILTRARAAGVSGVIMPSTGLDDMKKVSLLAKETGQSFLAGIHPESAEEITVDSEIEKTLAGYLQDENMVGVGEIGLDFHYDPERKTLVKQRELFRMMIGFATKHKLPVAIHMREAEKEMAEEMALFDSSLRGQFHCFAGSENFLEMVLAQGFYVSFCGNITYKSASDLRERLKKVPLERLLLETDSPYLSPEPRRGTINEPSNVKIIAEFVAKEKNVSFEELAEITTKNAKCLYSLGD